MQGVKDTSARLSLTFSLTLCPLRFLAASGVRRQTRHAPFTAGRLSPPPESHPHGKAPLAWLCVLGALDSPRHAAGLRHACAGRMHTHTRRVTGSPGSDAERRRRVERERL